MRGLPPRDACLAGDSDSTRGSPWSLPSPVDTSRWGGPIHHLPSPFILRAVPGASPCHLLWAAGSLPPLQVTLVMWFMAVAPEPSFSEAVLPVPLSIQTGAEMKPLVPSLPTQAWELLTRVRQPAWAHPDGPLACSMIPGQSVPLLALPWIGTANCVLGCLVHKAAYFILF